MPPFGMGLDVESSCGPGMGFPLGWFLLGFRVCDGPVGSEYSTHVPIRSRGSCHIWERPPTLRDILSPAHPPCFIDISAMLPCNIADMSLPGGRGRKTRKGVRGQVLDSSRGIGMTGLRGLKWGRGGRDGLAMRGPPPLDPSTVLRVSGPSRGWIPSRGPE